MPSLRYWICTDTSIKSGWVKRLLWANISTLNEMIFSLKIRSELIGHCIIKRRLFTEHLPVMVAIP
jgi:hypothetical protein